jgi:MULE transposase domain
MQTTFREELEVHVSRSKCRRCKLLVMNKFLESYTSQYSQIWDYTAALALSNPGNSIIVKIHRVNDESKLYFQRMYTYFDACKRGFRAGCRSVIGLDGSFSKGLVKFEILCAMGRYANNQMYPIARAVVEVENKKVWDWFLDLLVQDLEIGSRYGYVIITDQQNVCNKYLFVKLSVINL